MRMVKAMMMQASETYGLSLSPVCGSFKSRAQEHEKRAHLSSRI